MYYRDQETNDVTLEPPDDDSESASPIPLTVRSTEIAESSGTRVSTLGVDFTLSRKGTSFAHIESAPQSLPDALRTYSGPENAPGLDVVDATDPEEYACVSYVELWEREVRIMIVLSAHPLTSCSPRWRSFEMWYLMMESHSGWRSH